jgi:hypothetical protein
MVGDPGLDVGACRAHYNVRGIPVTHDWRLIFSLGHASRLSRFEATAP